MRLIDADMVLETCNSFKGMNRTKDIGIKLVNDIVGNAPTVDAEPIRHGHWKEHSWDWEKKVCSLCGGTVEGITYQLKDGRVRLKGTPYCPHCGALMEEVEDE